ncbi:AMP-binding protein, partial [Pelomonas sp. BJYL3]|uniref:AMP-binding protein n=1 Tax=Pelomonas sp. BJYL3 TaxID=2976697 RepID=UPI0022B49C29
EGDGVLVASSHSFDLTQKNLLAPLLVGGCVHLGVEPFDAQGLLEQIEQQGPRWLNLAPSAFHALIEADQGRGSLSRLSRVMLGGEPIQVGRLQQMAQPRPQVVNNYGPTECADVVAWQALSPEHGVDEVVPLGRAVRNTQMYVLDERQQLLPLGVVGEICVAGVGVGRGYLHQPQLTEERFVADPFSEEAGARMYKTGDLGRWLADGTLEYLGRNDFQVKIRGFRIELGEIEAKLAALGAEEAGDVVVLAREDQPGDKRLVAYYTGTASAEQLRAQAEATLPSYMVPAACVQLASLPLNPNGKLDRKALPAPDEQAWSRRAYEAPQGEVEATLAALWAELLQLERVGRHDNFFELGGHSLMAVQLMSRMRVTFGVELPLSTLFDTPSLTELAHAVLQASAAQYEAQDIAQAMAQLEGLSEEEIAALLAQDADEA